MERSRPAVALAVALVVIAAVPVVTPAASDGFVAGTPGALGPSDHPDEAHDALAPSFRAGPVDDPSNDTTVHENPDEVDERGDLAAVVAWLEGRLGGRLEGSLVELERGEYERARSRLGDGYDDLLGRYVDVAGDTDREGDPYEQTRNDQEAFVDAVEDYHETREEYERARADGDDQRVRELARELERHERRVHRTGSDLRESYEALDGVRGTNPGAAAERIRAIEADVTEQQETIRESAFVATRVTVTAESSDVSFLDPLVLAGRLVTEEGAPIADETVRFRVGGRTVETATDEGGRFSFTYRPTTLPLGDGTVTVEYVPANASLFLGSNDSVAVDVSQVTPRLSIDVPTTTVAFDEEVTVTGRVAAEDLGAGGVPVVVHLGDVQLGMTRTNPDGSFSFRTQLPATVPAGTRQLTVEVAQRGRAIASVAAATSVEVETTETDLGLTAEQAGPGEVKLAGALTTADGRPVADQDVRLFVAGEHVATVRTDGDGSFETTVAIPGENGSGENESDGPVTVEAAYEAGGTNLAAVEAMATVELAPPAVQPSGPDNPDAGSGGLQIIGGMTVPWPWVGVAGGVCLLVGGGVAALRRRRPGGPPSSADVKPSSREAATKKTPAQDEDEHTRKPIPLDVARERLAEGATDEAVRIAYGAVRRLASNNGVEAGWTHWEFYLAYEAAATDEERLAAVRRLTETYEHAAYAPVPVTPADANEAVDLAERIVDRARSG